MTKGYEIFSKTEPEHFHLARLRKAGERFEIVIEPDLALKFREGESVKISEILITEKIFKDAKKGMAASENMLKKLFKTDDVYKIAEVILKQGEIQLTQQYREKLREQKKKKIIEAIRQNGIDPRTNAPIPVERLENALRDAKVKIEEHRTAEDQVKRIIKELQPILPIKIELKEIEITLKSQYAAKSYSLLKRISTIVKDKWNSDGSLTCIVQVPAGMFNEFIDKMNSFTHGSIETRII